MRFALEQQPVLAPFADSVSERFHEWLRLKDQEKLGRDGISPASGTAEEILSRTKAGTVAFTEDQLTWLHLIRDHIATAISIEPEDFDYSPFSQKGGLGKAHQLFGEQLPRLLDELNTVLAA